MKFLVLMVLGCSLSTICAADVAVMRPPSSLSSMSVDSPRSVSSNKSDQFRETIDVALYMQNELDAIHGSLGDAAYKDACDRIGDLPFKLLTKENLQKIFDDIRKGIKKANAVKLSNTQKLEKVLRDNTSMGFAEFEKNKDTQGIIKSIKALNIDGIQSGLWDTVLQLSQDILKDSGTDQEKLREIKGQIESALALEAHIGK